ncbi:hypothetical protein [Saliniramus fredricksonii]|nr:hypothetical protein [Saliniramus fredricksonii]
MLDWCRANGIAFIFGVATTSTLRKRVATVEASTTRRFERAKTKTKVRRFKEFHIPRLAT